MGWLGCTLCFLCGSCSLNSNIEGTPKDPGRCGSQQEDCHDRVRISEHLSSISVYDVITTQHLAFILSDRNVFWLQEWNSYTDINIKTLYHNPSKNECESLEKGKVVSRTIFKCEQPSAWWADWFVREIFPFRPVTIGALIVLLVALDSIVKRMWVCWRKTSKYGDCLMDTRLLTK